MDRITWPIVTIVAVIAAAVVGLYALAPATSRPELGQFIPSVVSALFAAGALAQSRVVSNKHEDVSKQLHQIKEQTNGHLSEAITAAVREAMPADEALKAALADLLEGRLADEKPTTSTRSTRSRK